MKKFISQFSVKGIVLTDVAISTPLALALILAAEPIAQLAGGPGATFYLVAGILLLLWCVDMTVMAFYEPWLHKYFDVMIAIDVIWSMVSLALMLWFADSLLALGWVLFALNVIVPLDMAWMKRTVGGRPFAPELR